MQLNLNPNLGWMLNLCPIPRRRIFRRGVNLPLFRLVHRFHHPNLGCMPNLSLKLRRRNFRCGVDQPVFRLVRRFRPRNSRACQFCTFEYHFYHAKLDRVLNLNPNSGCMPNLSLKLRRRIFRRGVDLPLFPLVHRFRLQRQSGIQTGIIITERLSQTSKLKCGSLDYVRLRFLPCLGIYKLILQQKIESMNLTII